MTESALNSLMIFIYYDFQYIGLIFRCQFVFLDYFRIGAWIYTIIILQYLNAFWGVFNFFDFSELDWNFLIFLISSGFTIYRLELEVC